MFIYTTTERIVIYTVYRSMELFVVKVLYLFCEEQIVVYCGTISFVVEAHIWAFNLQGINVWANCVALRKWFRMQKRRARFCL